MTTLTNNYEPLNIQFMKPWQKNAIIRFFSDEKQEKLLRILDGLKKVTAAHEKNQGPAPVESFYDELFTEIFPKDRKTTLKLWNEMRLEERFGFVKAATAVSMLYKQAWNKYPEFIPPAISRIVHSIMRTY